MSDPRWTTRKVVVAGPSGRETPAEVRVRAPAEGASSLLVTLGMMAVLVTLSFFAPPVLLLNIPLLIVRAFVGKSMADLERRVAVGTVACPECGATVDLGERRGELPVAAPCPACAAPLEVRQPPRRNLVDLPPGSPLS